MYLIDRKIIHYPLSPELTGLTSIFLLYRYTEKLQEVIFFLP